MASSRDLTEVISSVLALNRSTCINIYRELRSAGLVSNEGRGRNAAAMTSRDATSYLIAVCTAEQVLDAADAVRRYATLLAEAGPHASGMVVPSPTWEVTRKEFPRLADLPVGHTFADALAALVESYGPSNPEATVIVSFRGPYPWAAVKIIMVDGKANREIWYSDEGDEYGPGELAFIDETKARQRRKFVALGGDMNITAAITGTTLAALGNVLRR